MQGILCNEAGGIGLKRYQSFKSKFITNNRDQ